MFRFLLPSIDTTVVVFVGDAFLLISVPTGVFICCSRVVADYRVSEFYLCYFIDLTAGLLGADIPVGRVYGNSRLSWHLCDNPRLMSF